MRVTDYSTRVSGWILQNSCVTRELEGLPCTSAENASAETQSDELLYN